MLRKNTTYSAWGNIRYETWYDADGQIIEGADPWANEDAVDQLFYYTGRLFDKFTGLQNNLNRWYDPSIGRWISEDPSGFAAGDENLYRYVQNQPTNFTDPSGEAWWNPRDWFGPKKPPPLPKQLIGNNPSHSSGKKENTDLPGGRKACFAKLKELEGGQYTVNPKTGEMVGKTYGCRLRVGKDGRYRLDIPAHGDVPPEDIHFNP